MRTCTIVILFACFAPLAAAQPATAPSSPALTDAHSHGAAAVTAWNKGQLDPALAESQATLDAYQKVYPNQDNPDIAQTLTAIASCLFQLDRADDALPKFQAAMEMYRRLSGNHDSQDLAIATSNVGWCLHTLERD